MKRGIYGWLLGAALLASAAGFASAQILLPGAQSGSPAAANAVHPPVAKPEVEPKTLAGLTTALNDARRRTGLPELAWSDALVTKAMETTKQTAASCSLNTASRIAREREAAVFWAAALPRMDGAGGVQEISPGYIVGEWRSARAEIDRASGKCRDKSAACEAWRLLSAPEVRKVGCTRTICPSNAQVWACHFDH
jgi:Cysteine-rich secretory protein family